MDTTTTTGRASMLDGNARRVLQCLAAAEPLPGATDRARVAVDMRRVRRRLGLRPSDVMLALRGLEHAGMVTDITTDGHDPATGPECGPVRVFRLETRQGKGQAR